MKAVYPGSFDPFTLGHLNILERATKIFDSITVVIAKNSQKEYMFVNDENIDVIIRGIRGSTDLDHEIKLEQYNSKVCTAEDKLHIESYFKRSTGLYKNSI